MIQLTGTALYLPHYILPREKSAPATRLVPEQLHVGQSERCGGGGGGGSLEQDVGSSAQFQVAVAEPQRVVLVGVALLLDVAGEGVRLGEQDGLLQRADLRADVEQLDDVVVRRRRVALQTQHLEETALLALASDQHLHQPTMQPTSQSVNQSINRR